MTFMPAVVLEQTMCAFRVHVESSSLQFSGLAHVRGMVHTDVILIAYMQGSVERLTQDKVDLEASLEMEEEAFINNLVRQLSGFMQNYQAMDRVRTCDATVPSSGRTLPHETMRIATSAPWGTCMFLRLHRLFLARVLGNCASHANRRAHVRCAGSLAMCL